jgi:5-methyltetrahydropteroyltriglutamate--homocysteine methyltransferase
LSAPRPPFRADHVGSLLRPPALAQARTAFLAGQLDAAALAAVEDREIDRVIAKQAEIGLKVATDGDFRRRWWQYDFFRGLEGVETVVDEGRDGRPWQGPAGATVIGGGDRARVAGRIRFKPHPMVAHFAYLKAHTTALAKVTLPSPSVLHASQTRGAGVPAPYRDDAEFIDDIAIAWRDAVAAFAAAGCRYLQFDDTVWAMLCSPRERDKLRAAGRDPTRLVEAYAKAINTAIAARPEGMTIAMHLCRGNFRSAWRGEGGYEPVADALFNTLAIDGYFLEYDSDRAGGFEPLRLLPKSGKRVVLGLVTSKSGAIESVDTLTARIHEAARFTPLDNLCISPQCGFASTEEGNLLSEDEQWAKLRRVVEVADLVWSE